MEKKLYYQVKKSVDLSKLPEIKGYDFDEEFDFKKFIDSFFHTGIQAHELGKAINVTNMMIKNDARIYLSFTSNMVSSGIREVIKYLVKNKRVHVLSTSCGAIEEDIIKTLLPFRTGNFDSPGSILFEKGVQRIGNIYVTYDHYTKFEFFIRKVFAELSKIQEKTKRGVTPTEIIQKMGEMIEKEEGADYESSILYWAYKNDIKIYCPAIVDGTIGDILYFYKNKDPNFQIDVSRDHDMIVNDALNAEQTGCIVLGGGTPKHYILNANIFREGFDYAVYISTSQYYDASDSGGNQEEAISWAKIKSEAPRAKVHCEASIAFPLLVAGSFAQTQDL